MRVTIEVPEADLNPTDGRLCIVLTCDCGRGLSCRVTGSATCKACGRYYSAQTVALDADRSPQPS